MIIKNPCVVDHRRPNSKLLRVITAYKNLTQSTELTFIPFGYFPSDQELSNGPSQHILRHKQRTDEQRKAMFSKREQWILYVSSDPTIRFSFLWTRNIRVDGHPGAGEDCNQTAPNYIPNRSAMREVIAVIPCQRAVFDGWNGASVDRGALKQVIEKE